VTARNSLRLSDMIVLNKDSKLGYLDIELEDKDNSQHLKEYRKILRPEKNQKKISDTPVSMFPMNFTNYNSQDRR